MTLRTTLTALALLMAAPALAQTTEAPAGVAGLTVENARMVLAPVAGNPAAIYFDIAYEGDKSLVIRQVAVEGAGSAMMHDYGEYDFKVQMMEMPQQMLRGGDKVSFEPGGKHIMAMDPSADLAPGGTTNVTLTLVGGDTHSFPVEIRAAGEDR